MYEMTEELKFSVFEYFITFFPILCLMLSRKKHSGKEKLCYSNVIILRSHRMIEMKSCN